MTRLRDKLNCSYLSEHPRSLAELSTSKGVSVEEASSVPTLAHGQWQIQAHEIEDGAAQFASICHVQSYFDPQSTFMDYPPVAREVHEENSHIRLAGLSNFPQFGGSGRIICGNTSFALHIGFGEESSSSS